MSAQLDDVSGLIQAQYSHSWLELPNRGPRYFFLYSHLGRLGEVHPPPFSLLRHEDPGPSLYPPQGIDCHPRHPGEGLKTRGWLPHPATTRTRGGPRGAPQRP